ncbi:PD-(D/E)XK nuclease family protein [Vibrio cholerae]
MDTQLTRFEQLLDEFSELEPFVAAEPTIFSIGSKGYFENPTTDILAFFCDNNGQHQLGDVALKALLSCLPKEYHSLDSSLVAPPEREVRTEAGKRIDLLLEASDWVLILENKIYHQQNNPFEDYENFTKENRHKERFQNKQKLFVLLSPTGESLPSNWQGISYAELISALKTELAERFITHPLNKWIMLLREFILHIESFMTQPTVPSKTLDFVLNNLSEINQLQQLKQNTVNNYHAQLQTQIQQKLGKDVSIRLKHWSGLPALRFALAHWESTESDVVLYLTGEADSTSITAYADLKGDKILETADSLFLIDPMPECWSEGHQRYRAYRVAAGNLNTEQRVSMIAERLDKLDQFEGNKLGAIS